ncbi:MAG TPA: hypothetical protein DDW49_09820 [Deltaproteobacteria bacterium]|nr:MAG: hypothetical protein A2048_01700 [Deltaproteobacteria bacterium GWA2_45_12]HBF13660.1 hypothetical protein [Deltaproteobacteria bacterium]
MPKKEQYRLEPLVKLKQRQKRESEIKLARAIRELEKEKEILKKIENLKKEIGAKREKTRNDLRKKVASGQARIKESEYYIGFMQKLMDDEEKVDEEIKLQKEVIEKAEEKLKRAKRDYIDAAQELNIMEKHKQLWTKKMRLKLTALEDKKMNELALVAYQMSRMKG